MKNILIDVYHRPDKPDTYARFIRSWDTSIYMEVGVSTDTSVVGPPPAGPHQPFCFQGGDLVRSAELSADGRPVVFLHRRISVNDAVKKELILCNG